MSQFTEEQMMSAINQDGIVKDSCINIKKACQELKIETGCPDEDIDSLLKFLIGRWQKSD